MSGLRRVCVGLLVVAVGLIVASCTSDDSGGSAGGGSGVAAAAVPPAQFIAEGTLTVCVDAPKYPFAFQSGNGSWLGADIEVLRFIADELNRELEIKDMQFERIWTRPGEGECDLAAAAITVTDARRAEAAFSQSYLNAAQSVMIRTNDSGSYTNLASLAGRQVGVKTNTTSEAYLRANLPTGARVITFADTEDMFVALGARNVDATVADLPINGYRSTLDTAVTVIEVVETGEVYGIAAASSNTGLIAAVDKALAKYLASDAYRSLLGRWFGVR